MNGAFMPSYFLETTFYIALAAAGIRIAAPLIFASIGEVFAERGRRTEYRS